MLFVFKCTFGLGFDYAPTAFDQLIIPNERFLIRQTLLSQVPTYRRSCASLSSDSGIDTGNFYRVSLDYKKSNSN